MVLSVIFLLISANLHSAFSLFLLEIHRFNSLMINIPTNNFLNLWYKNGDKSVNGIKLYCTFFFCAYCS